jgi:hypothetical protein
MGRRNNNRTFNAILAIALIAVVCYFTYAPFTTWVDGIFTPTEGNTVGDGDMVYPKVQVKESLGAYADEDIIVNAYSSPSGGFDTWLGSATASSGIATFGFQVEEGTTIYLQGRAAAPATADGYITPITQFIVGQGDDTDTVSCRNAQTNQDTLWVNNLHDSTEPLWNMTTIDSGQILLGSSRTDNLTTADLGFVFRISIADDDCWFGAADFTDGQSEKSYSGGIWLLIKSGTDSYSFDAGAAREHISWYEDGAYYYAWNFYVQLWQSSTLDNDQNTYTAVVYIAGGNDFDKGASTLTCDVYDMKLVTGSPQVADFVDGGALATLTGTGYVD